MPLPKPLTPAELEAIRPTPTPEQPFPNQFELQKLLGFGDGLPAAPARRLAALLSQLHERLEALEKAQQPPHLASIEKR